MQARRLILTADDFGRSPTVNAAIGRWARAGALTQASLLVNEAHAPEAVQLARALPDLRVGLHLALCDGLASDGTALPRSPAGAGFRYALLPWTHRWLAREISAQFARFLALGFPPTYWDGHAHLHLHPVVLAITLPIARQHGFTFTRLVREPGPRRILPAIFQLLSTHAAPALRAAGIGFADRVFGLRQSGKMDRAEVARALRHATSGTTEIYFHPGAEKAISESDVVKLVRESAEKS